MALFVRIVNYLGFYALWMLCVMAIVAQKPLWAIVGVVLYLIIHFLCISRTPKRELLFLLLLTAVGLLNETWLWGIGVVTYVGAYWGGIAWWTISLWICFATTYWHAFSWLEGRPWISAVLGAAAAPFCYAWIEQEGGITFPRGAVVGLLVIGGTWAVLLPLSFCLSRWMRFR